MQRCHVSVVKIPSDMDTVDTLEGLRRTVGVGREAHPGDAGPVGGRFPPGDNVTKRSKKATKTEKEEKKPKAKMKIIIET